MTACPAMGLAMTGCHSGRLTTWLATALLAFEVPCHTPSLLSRAFCRDLAGPAASGHPSVGTCGCDMCVTTVIVCRGGAVSRARRWRGESAAERWRGGEHYLGADMFWDQADTATYLRWLQAARLTPLAPLPPGRRHRHSVIVSRAS
jgi:hypothetical protein